MNWNLGVAFKATPAVTVALDYAHIDYSGVKSIHNSGITAGYTGPTNPLALGGTMAWDSVGPMLTS